MNRFLLKIIMSTCFLTCFLTTLLSCVVSASNHPQYPGFSVPESGFVINNNVVSMTDDIIYKQGWYSVNGTAWQSYSLTGNLYYGNEVWLAGTATYTLPSTLIATGKHYIIAYGCKYNNGWDCHGNQWQLIVRDNPVPPANPNPINDTPTCPDNYANCDGNNANGCETALGTVTNCAQCGNACASGQICNNKVCTTVQNNIIIINHTTTDLSKIPDYWLNEAKKLTMHYAHTSHGSQILSGMEYLEQNVNSKYSFVVRTASTEGLPASENPIALRIYDGTLGGTYATPELYWETPNGVANTRSVASTGKYNTSMWSWCGQASYYSTSQIYSYVSIMKTLNDDYPNMNFILMTGHTDGTDLLNSYSVLTQNNQIIRDYAINNSIVLFDFADIESYDPAGNYYRYMDGSEGCLWCQSWCDSNPSECGNMMSLGCAHSAGPVCVQKAKAYWWMMARIAGWPGP